MRISRLLFVNNSNWTNLLRLPLLTLITLLNWPRYSRSSWKTRWNVIIIEKLMLDWITQISQRRRQNCVFHASYANLSVRICHKLNLKFKLVVLYFTFVNAREIMCQDTRLSTFTLRLTRQISRDYLFMSLSVHLHCT